MTNFSERLESEIADIDRQLGLELHDLWLEWRGIAEPQADGSVKLDWPKGWREEDRKDHFFYDTPDVKKYTKTLQTQKRRLMKLLKGTLAPEDVRVGHLYRGRRPREVLFRGLDDRVVLFVSGTGLNCQVQYDSYSVRTGSRYPTVTMEKFLAWASHEVTDEEKAKRTG